MKINVSLTTIIIAIALLLGGVFYFGYHQGKNSVETTTKTVTVIKYDTIVHSIPSVPSVTTKYLYVEKHDTIQILIPNKVDSAQVIKDYYTKIYKERKWEDSLIVIILKDTLFKNKIFNDKIEYKILRPQTIITNTTNINNYNTSIYAGVDFALSKITNETQFNINYASKKLDLKFGVEPFNPNYKFVMGVAVKIFNFK
jgi:hypothetical protein